MGRGIKRRVQAENETRIKLRRLAEVRRNRRTNKLIKKDKEKKAKEEKDKKKELMESVIWKTVPGAADPWARADGDNPPPI